MSKLKNDDRTHVADQTVVFYGVENAYVIGRGNRATLWNARNALDLHLCSESARVTPPKRDNLRHSRARRMVIFLRNHHFWKIPEVA